MIMVSVGSWRKKANPAAKRRISVIGLLNWERRSVRLSDRFFGLRMLAPYLLRRSLLSELFRPSVVVWSSCNISGAGTLQNASFFSLLTNRMSPYFCSVTCVYFSGLRNPQDFGKFLSFASYGWEFPGNFRFFVTFQVALWRLHNFYSFRWKIGRTYLLKEQNEALKDLSYTFLFRLLEASYCWFLSLTA